MAWVSSAYERVFQGYTFKRALKKGQFELFYQPIIQLRSNQVVGAEALVRWRRSEADLIHPQHFLPQIKENGLMKQLDLWVLQTAIGMRLRANESARLSVLEEFHIFVNLDATQIQDKDFTENLVNLIKEAQIQPHELVIEISENGSYETDLALDNLRILRENGIQIALDDFGIGLANLHQLRQLPLNLFKLDKSFISDIFLRKSDKELLVNIQQIAELFNLHILVEGVETKVIHDYISSIGVHCAQGYFYSPALPEKDFWLWVEKYMENQD